MPTINIDEVQANLNQLVDQLKFDEPLIITRNGEPVASLSKPQGKSWACKAGSAKNTSHWMADDFDAPLDDFKEYME